MRKLLLLSFGMSVTLFACSDDDGATIKKEETVEAVSEEKASKDTITYEINGKENEVKVEPFYPPSGYGKEILLPGKYEVQNTPYFFVMGTGVYEGINFGIDKEPFEESDYEFLEDKLLYHMRMPLTGEAPTVTEFNDWDKHPEFKGEYEYIFRAEASNTIYYTLTKIINNEKYVVSARISPEGDKAFEDYVLEVLKTTELE